MGNGIVEKFIDVTPDEWKPARLLIVHAFFSGLMIVFFESAASALFLSKFDAESIPYAYVAGAFIFAAIGTLYGKLEERLRPTLLFKLVIAFLFVTVLTFSLSAMLSELAAFAFMLFIWVDVLTDLARMEFWGLTGKIFNVRQGKRLFGLIGGGEVIGGFVGGLMVPVLLMATTTEVLPFISVLCLVGIFLILGRLCSQYSSNIEAADDSGDEDAEAAKTRLGFRDMFRKRYIVILLFITVSYVLTYYLVDYSFYMAADARFTDEEKLAGFFGMFWAIANAVELLLRLLVSAPVLRKYGVKGGLIMLPAIAGVSVAASLVSGIMGAAGILFWCIVAVKFLKVVLLGAMHQPSFAILYQPFPVKQRMAVQIKVEGVVEPVMGGLAGVLIIFLTFLSEFNPVYISAILILILVAWLAMIRFAAAEYVAMMLNALSMRFLDKGGMNVPEGASIGILESSLKSDYPAEAMYALHLLEEMNPKGIPQYARQLADHPSAEVREKALGVITKHNCVEALPEVRARLREESDPKLKGAALKAYCVLSDDEAHEDVIPYLSAEDPILCKSAVVGFLMSGGIDSVLAAGNALRNLVVSEDVSKRRLAADIIAEAEIRGLHRPLRQLLKDPDDSVRIAALEAAGKIGAVPLWPLVIEALGEKATRRAAIRALADGGDSIAPAIEAYFDSNQHSPRALVPICIICGRMRGRRVESLMLKAIEHPSARVRGEALKALYAHKFKPSKDLRPFFARIFDLELHNAVTTLQRLHDINEREEFAPLLSSLNNELLQLRWRMFMILSFLYDRNSITKAMLNCANDNDERRAIAVEILDNLLNEEHRTMFLPFVESGAGAVSILDRYALRFEVKPLTAQQRIADIIREGQNAWSTACAVYAAVNAGMKTVMPEIILAAGSEESIVRDTAESMLQRMNLPLGER